MSLYHNVSVPCRDCKSNDYFSYTSDRNLCRSCFSKRGLSNYHKNSASYRARHRKWNREHPETARKAAKRKRERAKTVDPVRAWARSARNSAMARALKKHLPFDLSIDDVVSLATTKCPALGISLEYGHNSVQDNSPSLDRTIPDLGYVRGNVVVLSVKANRIKSNATAEEVSSVATYMQGIT